MRYSIRVIPNSKKDEVLEEKDRKLIIVRVREKPQKGKATIKVLKILEHYFNKKVRLVSGAFSREKIIEVD